MTQFRRNQTDNKKTSYIDKERAIIKKLQETNYALFNGDKDKALATIESDVSSFGDYANTVIHAQNESVFLDARFDKDTIREKEALLQRSKQAALEVAQVSAAELNQVSKALGLEPFADVDIKDVRQLTDFIGEYVDQMYAEGTNTDFDHAIKMRKDYYTDNSRDRIAQIDAEFGDILEQDAAQASGPEDTNDITENFG